MARKFFYVCAGLFLLALSWHLGARNARAQASPGYITASLGYYCGGHCWIAATSDRMVYKNGVADPGGPVPGSSPIIGVGVGAHGHSIAILEDGSVYSHSTQTSNQDPWIYVGQAAPASPTKATETSWGSLKARYR